MFRVNDACNLRTSVAIQPGCSGDHAQARPRPIARGGGGGGGRSYTPLCNHNTNYLIHLMARTSQAFSAACPQTYMHVLFPPFIDSWIGMHAQHMLTSNRLVGSSQRTF